MILPRRLALATLSGLVIGAIVVSPLSAAPVRSRPPIRLHAWGSIAGGWHMKVVSVRPNVKPEASGYGRQPPGVGTYIVRVALRYSGQGPDNLLSVIDSLELVGRHVTYADANPCIGPWTRTYGYVRVVPGTSLEGDICFQDQTRDAPTARLFVYMLLGTGSPFRARPLQVFDLR